MPATAGTCTWSRRWCCPRSCSRPTRSSGAGDYLAIPRRLLLLGRSALPGNVHRLANPESLTAVRCNAAAMRRARQQILAMPRLPLASSCAGSRRRCRSSTRGSRPEGLTFGWLVDARGVGPDSPIPGRSTRCSASTSWLQLVPRARAGDVGGALPAGAEALGTRAREGSDDHVRTRHVFVALRAARGHAVVAPVTVRAVDARRAGRAAATAHRSHRTRESCSASDGLPSRAMARAGRRSVRRRARAEADAALFLAVALLTLAVYLVSARGLPQTFDEQIIYDTTASLVHGKADIGPPLARQFPAGTPASRVAAGLSVKRSDGRRAGIYGLGTSAVGAPLYVVGRLVARGVAERRSGPRSRSRSRCSPTRSSPRRRSSC